MAGQNWPEGSVDAQCSVDLKKVGNAKAWWRRGRCLLEMGRIEEARAWVAEGLEFEGQETELLGLMEEIKQRLAKGER
jgi:translocation protein SEC72